MDIKEIIEKIETLQIELGVIKDENDYLKEQLTETVSKLEDLENEYYEFKTGFYDLEEHVDDSIEELEEIVDSIQMKLELMEKAEYAV